MEDYITTKRVLKSKRSLQLILSIEELEIWQFGQLQLEYLLTLSRQAFHLVQLKMFFYANFAMAIFERFRIISYIDYDGLPRKERLAKLKKLQTDMVKAMKEVTKQAEIFLDELEEDKLEKEMVNAEKGGQ